MSLLSHKDIRHHEFASVHEKLCCSVKKGAVLSMGNKQFSAVIGYHVSCRYSVAHE